MSTLNYAFVVIVWGLTWIAIKNQLGDVSEVASICYRSAGAGLILFTYLLIRRMPLKFSWRAHVRMFLIGTCMFSVNYLFLYGAEAHISSGLTALIFAMTLPLNVVNSAIFLRRRIARSVVAGGVLGVLGMVLVFRTDLRGFSLSNGSLVGMIEAFLAALCFSLGNVVSDRAQFRGVPIVQSEAYGLAYGTLILAVSALCTGGFAFDPSPHYAISLGYLIVFGSVVGFGLYLSIIGRIGAERAGYVTVLFPVVALLVSTVFEGYRWTGAGLAGAACILVGNAIVATPPELVNRARNRVSRHQLTASSQGRS